MDFMERVVRQDSLDASQASPVGVPISSRSVREICEMMGHVMIGAWGSNTGRAVNCGGAWSKSRGGISNRPWSGEKVDANERVWGRRGQAGRAHVVDLTLWSVERR